MKLDGLELFGPGDPDVLATEALAFVAKLQHEFGPTRAQLLARRRERQDALRAGSKPDFLSDTQEIRASDWRVAPPPDDLQDRRVEITGPVDRKMMINALNSGARVFMADFEDACSPTWTNIVEGQRNVHDASRCAISLETPEKSYVLADEIATLVVRPRGWHLTERHVLIDGEPVSASLFDFGLTVFHNAHAQLERGSGPYFYGHTGLQRFIDAIGVPRTKELFLTGRNLDAERAEKIGLVHEVVDDAALEPVGVEWAAEVAANAPLSMKGNKHAIDMLNAFGRLTEEQQRELIELRESCFRSEDFREGISAFAEKRKPVWKGR